ncbi:MAG: SPFH domain-containing protein [Gammaproteobacteria bacterium]|nr:SPFH domain-containing protein [Gammaproteobacteria bacterium]
MPFYLKAFNSGPPDLEEWFKKVGRSFAPKKKNPLSMGPEQNEASPWWWLFILIILCLVLLVFSSVVTVKPTEKMVITRFGALTAVEGPGLHWTIPLVDQRTIVDVTQVLSVSDQALLLTKEGDLVKTTVVLNYQVADPQKYLFYGPVTLLLQKQLAAALISVMQNQNAVSLLSVHAWPDLNTQIDAALPSLTAYGITLKGVSVNNVSVPDTMSQTFNATVQIAKNQVQKMMDSANQFAALIKPLSTQEASSTLQNSNAQQFSILVNAQRDASNLTALQTAYSENPAVTAAYLPILLQQNSRSAEAINQTQSQASNQNTAYLRWQAGNDAQVQEAQDAQTN